MTQHRVTWSIDVFNATGPEDAARLALRIILNPDPASIVHVFEVGEVTYGKAGVIFGAPVTVDLDEIDLGEVPS